MKECSTCKKIKPLTEFYKHDKTKDGYDSNCKQCKSARNHQYVEKRNILKDQLKLELGGKCIKCGYNKCLAALDFHHRNPSEKDFDISSMLSHKGLTEDVISAVREEVKKCDLLCANCHREEHYLKG